MINHIVMFKFKEFSLERDKQENIQLVKESLQSLSPKIREIEFFELGVNLAPASNAYDLVLVSKFKGPEELISYQKHPDHVKVADLAGQVCEARIVVDYAT